MHRTLPACALVAFTRSRPRSALAGLCMAVFLQAAPSGALEWVDLSLTEGTNFSVSRIPGASPEEFIIDLQGTLWRLSRDGGPAQPLTDGLGDDRLPDVAPDASRVVYQSFREGSWDIWSIAPDGSGQTPLTHSPFDDREPVVSPDGSRVAFSSDRSGNYDIWVLDLKDLEALEAEDDGGDARRVTEHPSNDSMPAWSADGDRLFYVSDRNADFENTLVELNLADGTERVIRRFDEKIASPSSSPDGKWLTLQRLEFQPLILMGSRFDLGESSELILLSVEDSETPLRSLATGEDVFPFRASWADEGRLFATAGGRIVELGLAPDSEAVTVDFEVRVSLNRPSYVRRAPALPGPGERRQVRGIVRPTVSPDGETLVYSALGDLWTVPMAGGNAAPMTRDEFLDAGASFSPDGSQIVYSTDRGGSMDLWVKEVGTSAGSGERQVTFSLGAEWGAAFSPQGSRIAFLDERSRLLVVSSEGGEPSLVYAPRGSVSLPSWSPDGEHIAMAVMSPYSSRFREGRNRILIVNVSSGEVRVLAEPSPSVGTRGGDGPVWSPDGRHLAFVMEGGLWLMPVDRSGNPTDRSRQLVDEPADFLAWAGSDSLIYLHGDAVRRVDIEQGTVRNVDIDHSYAVAGTGGRLLLRNFRLIDGTGSEPREGMDVLVEGQRIAEIRPTGPPAPEDVRVIEGGGRILMPGLVELHTHLSQPTWGRRLGKIWLAFGVTTIRSPAASFYRVQEERETILAGLRVGPRIVTTGHTLDGDRIYYGGAESISGEEGLEQAFARVEAMGYDLVKTYVRLDDSLQKQAIDKAHDLGLPVTSHELFPAVANGIDGIEHIKGTSRRGFDPKISALGRSYGDVVSLIARSGVEFTPTVLIYGGFSLAHAREPALLDDERLHRLFPPWVAESFSDRKVADLATQKRLMAPVHQTLARIHEAGGTILAGTDSPIVPYGLSLLLEMEQLAEAGLSNLEILSAATLGAATALGLDGEIGSLEEGKLADFVILREDPSEDIQAIRLLDAVGLAGRMVTLPQLLRY